MRFGLTEITIEKICDIFSKYPQVEKAVLYGSRAKGNFKNGSDIDLVLYGDDDLSLTILYQIRQKIDELLLPYTIDLSIFNTLSDPDFIEHIERVGVVFYKKENLVIGDLKG